METLNDDVVEHIFLHLDFSSLKAAEMVCKKWKHIVSDRKLYLKSSPPHENLNDDVLEKIFTYLNFRSLIVAEMVCKRWKEIICERRLFWQLSKTLCRASKRKLPMTITFDSSNFRKEIKKRKQWSKTCPSRRKRW